MKGTEFVNAAKPLKERSEDLISITSRPCSSSNYPIASLTHPYRDQRDINKRVREESVVDFNDTWSKNTDLIAKDQKRSDLDK